MSKLLAIVASLKAILIAASVAFARGDMLPVIAVPRDTIVVARSHDEGR